MNVRTKKQRALRRERCRRQRRSQSVHADYRGSYPVWHRLFCNQVGRGAAPLRKGSVDHYYDRGALNRSGLPNAQMEKEA